MRLLLDLGTRANSLLLNIWCSTKLVCGSNHVGTIVMIEPKCVGNSCSILTKVINSVSAVICKFEQSEYWQILLIGYGSSYNLIKNPMRLAILYLALRFNNMVNKREQFTFVKARQIFNLREVANRWERNHCTSRNISGVRRTHRSQNRQSKTFPHSPRPHVCFIAFKFISSC